jgi:tetrathionate reductase subunit B
VADSQPILPLPWNIPKAEDIKRVEKVGMIIDVRRCVGCHACSVSCKTEHNVPLGDFRNRTHYAERPADSQTIAYIPMICMQCEDAPCVTACPVEAVKRKPDGRVTIFDCDSHKECIKACPYDAIFYNDQNQSAEKCDMCEHRTDLGMVPACVEVCPTEALRFGDLSDANDAVAQLTEQLNPVAYKADEKTNPRVRYLGLEPWMETKKMGVQRSDNEDGIVYE